MKKLILRAISFYQQATAWFRNAQVPGMVYTTCKFHPTCSEYAQLTIEKHGAFTGSLKAINRIVRCHPFASGGVDFPA
jgi:hypothetical protein